MKSEVFYLLMLVLVTGGMTLLLRASPFLLFGTGKKPPAIIGYIGSVLSAASIAMLVVYCFGCYLRDRPFLEHGYAIAEITASVTVIALQLWKRNPLLSIIAGTAVYMVLVQTILP